MIRGGAGGDIADFDWADIINAVDPNAQAVAAALGRLIRLTIRYAAPGHAYEELYHAMSFAIGEVRAELLPIIRTLVCTRSPVLVASINRHPLHNLHFDLDRVLQVLCECITEMFEGIPIGSCVKCKSAAVKGTCPGCGEGMCDGCHSSHSKSGH